MKLPFNLGRFWIRKDREEYLLAGVMVASVIASYVSAHWHFTDTLNALNSMRPTLQGPAKNQGKKIREVEYITDKSRAGKTEYYHMDSETTRAMPRLEENENEPAGTK